MNRIRLVLFFMLPPMVFLASCGKQGCTDSAAFNYEAGVKYDDGSCVYCDCGDTTATNYRADAFCAANDSCTYASDVLVGTFTGSAFYTLVSDSVALDTIDSIVLEIIQEDYDKKVLRVKEGDQWISMDTACGFPFFGHTDSTYVVFFDPFSDVSATPASCFDLFPDVFEFKQEGDSLTYFSRVILSGEGDTTGANIYRELIFSGNQVE